MSKTANSSWETTGKPIVVLTVISLIVSLLLALVNGMTAPVIAENTRRTTLAAYVSVMPSVSDAATLEEVTDYTTANVTGVVKAEDGSMAIKAGESGFDGGVLTVIMGFDAEGKIYNYSLLAHAEPPGLGSKADKWFGAYDPAKGEQAVSHEQSAKSILGMNPGDAPLAVTKDMNGQVDAITASTITSRAFLNAVNAAYQAYKGGTADTTSGASRKNEPATAPASEAAAEILSLDPDLSLEQHRALKHYLLKRQENASDGLGL